MNYFSSRLLALGLGVLASASVHAVEILSELTDAQKAVLRKGEQVVVTEDQVNSAWPKVRIYQMAHSLPEESMASFFDYPAQAKFMPNIKRVAVSRKIDPKTSEVDYVLEVPLMKDEWYTTRNILSSYEIAGETGYRVDWNLVRARTTRGTVGHIRVEEMDGQTVIAFFNFVTPGAAFAGAVKGKALQRVRDTVAALVKEIERVRVSEPAVLQRRLENLRTALRP